MTDSSAPATDPLKIKTRKPRQRACNQKSEKGKLCNGHLKRYYDFSPEVEAVVGRGAELYRCHRCHTFYQPHPRELPRSYVLRY
ncbi:MAG: hypothetical protein ACE5IP_04235 [Terriglobia bacterium]